MITAKEAQQISLKVAEEGIKYQIPTQRNRKTDNRCLRERRASRVYCGGRQKVVP